ncbi:coproporphyrinogen III oxidase [Sphingobacteriaceae bacterium]|nr:coproporphyrinogen III oxidase [Sphingobacteriaceae bacterium]
MPGIYLHIPFCKQACTYCDFHFSTNLQAKDVLVTSITEEISKRYSYLSKKNLESIYFGGGTPSLLSKSELQRIFNALKKYFSYTNSAEITLEANPDDITMQSLQDWKEVGINRLSIGLQSFNNEELKWMNRAHTAEESLASVKLAQAEGFNNISIDLIYGSKFQTLDSWAQTLDTAIALNTQHISSYNLTIEQKTVLGLKHNKGTEPAISDELSEAQFLLMVKKLKEAGFLHYEISNFGKPEFFAKHNSNYWLQEHYLGIGPSAHSFNGTSRQWNVKNNNHYINAIKNGSDFFEKEELSLHDRYNEYVLTRLRTIWGCDLDEIKEQFGDEILRHFMKIVQSKMAFLDQEANVYTLKESARFLADGLASDLFI